MLFQSKSRLLLDSLIYQSMRYYRGGAIAIAVITQEMLDASGVTENDMDDLASVAGKPEGVILSVTIKEKGPKLCKVRSEERRGGKECRSRGAPYH